MEMISQGPSLKKFGINILFILGSILLVSVLYSGILESPFQFDDIYNIRENTHIRLNELTIKGLLDAGIKSYASNRPVANISFALNYYFGGYSVFGYHLVNIAIHLLTGLFLFLLMKETLVIVQKQEQSILVTSNTSPVNVAAAVALVWLVHPLATQSVTYVVQRMTSMAAMFSVLSMFCYVRGRAGQGASRWFFYIGSILSWILAMGSKEIAAPLPFFVFLYEWYFLRDLDAKWLKKQISLIIGIIVFGIIIIITFLGTNPLDVIFGGYQIRDFTPIQRVLTEWRIVMLYLGLILIPYPGWLNLDHDITLSYSFLNPPTTLLSLLAILTLLGFAVWGARKYRILSFAILWFFGNLIIESTILSLELVYEHRTYLPAMFVIFAVVLAAHRLLKNRWARIAVFCFVLGLFSAWTYQRNLTWSDDLTLWTDVLMKSPNKARPHTNYALALMDRGRVDEAIKHYRISARLAPNVPGVYNGLAGALLTAGDVDEAIEQYTIAIKLDPDNVEFLLGMARAQEKKHQPEEAMRYYKQVLDLNPDNTEAINGIGKGLAHQGLYAEAIKHFESLLNDDPNNAEAYNSIGNIQIMQGNIEEAKSCYLKAIEMRPDYAEAYNNLGTLLIKNGKITEAVKYLEQAVALSETSKISLPRNNLAEAYVQQGDAVRQGGDMAGAVLLYEKALSVQNESVPALNRLVTAYAMQGEYARAAGLLERLRTIQPDNPDVHYNLACMLSKQGRTDEALDSLEQAIRKGFRDDRLLQTDPDLDNIRSEERFREIMRNK